MAFDPYAPPGLDKNRGFWPFFDLFWRFLSFLTIYHFLTLFCHFLTFSLKFRLAAYFDFPPFFQPSLGPPYSNNTTYCASGRGVYTPPKAKAANRGPIRCCTPYPPWPRLCFLNLYINVYTFNPIHRLFIKHTFNDLWYDAQLDQRYSLCIIRLMINMLKLEWSSVKL